MPSTPALSTTGIINPYEAAITSPGSISVSGQQREQNPIHDVTTINAGLQKEQIPHNTMITGGFNITHIVTTPISLPGMPPITVSASLPQNTSFYSSVLEQQNQFSPGITTTTVASTSSMSTQQ